MNFKPLNDDEIIRLWPTTVMKQWLSGSDKANLSLTALASNRGNHPWIEPIDDVALWLYRQIEHGADQYLKRAGLSEHGKVRIRANFEVHDFGACRSLANQPGTMLSGRYGVTLPTDTESGPGRDDLRPGYISFYDPRSAMNMNAINRDPYLHYHRSIVLKPGLLLMWPSYLSFFIHPNLSRTPRVSVAFYIYKETGTT